jgi:hypothetical protein
MVVRGVPDAHAGVVFHVAVGRRLNGQKPYRSRRSYRNSNQRERKNKMGQGAKQSHGQEANDGSRPPQPHRLANLAVRTMMPNLGNNHMVTR